MRMYAVAAQRGDRDALLAPLVSADQTEQLTQRGDVGLVVRAVGLRTGVLYIRCTAQRNHVARIERNEHHAERPRALGAGLPVKVERLRPGRFRLLAPPAWRTVDPARHRREELARVLEVAAPQQRGAFACKAVRIVRARLVTGYHHTAGRRRAALRPPADAMVPAALPPGDHVHGSTVAACVYLGHCTS